MTVLSPRIVEYDLQNDNFSEVPNAGKTKKQNVAASIFRLQPHRVSRFVISKLLHGLGIWWLPHFRRYGLDQFFIEAIRAAKETEPFLQKNKKRTHTTMEENLFVFKKKKLAFFTPPKTGKWPQSTPRLSVHCTCGWSAKVWGPVMAENRETNENPLQFLAMDYRTIFHSTLTVFLLVSTLSLCTRSFCTTYKLF